jgi:hypothetical protein
MTCFISMASRTLRISNKHGINYTQAPPRIAVSLSHCLFEVLRLDVYYRMYAARMLCRLRAYADDCTPGEAMPGFSGHSDFSRSWQPLMIGPDPALHSISSGSRLGSQARCKCLRFYNLQFGAEGAPAQNPGELAISDDFLISFYSTSCVAARREGQEDW